MSTKESEDVKEVVTTEKPATSETLTTTSTVKDKNFLGLNFNDVWTLGATALIATGLGATVGYFLGPAIRQWVDNIRQSAVPQSPPSPATATVPNLSPEELSKKYYADKIRQQQQQEQQFYESYNKQPIVKKKQRTPEASNYYDQYENDIPIIDDNDIFSKVNKRRFPAQEESFFKVRDEELHPFHQKQAQQQQKEEQQQQQQQQQKPMFNVESKKIPEEEVSMYTDDKIDINKLPPEFTNVGNRETSPTVTKDNDDYDITNLEMTEEELNNLAKNNNSSSG